MPGSVVPVTRSCVVALGLREARASSMVTGITSHMPMICVTRSPGTSTSGFAIVRGLGHSNWDQAMRMPIVVAENQGVARRSVVEPEDLNVTSTARPGMRRIVQPMETSLRLLSAGPPDHDGTACNPSNTPDHIDGMPWEPPLSRRLPGYSVPASVRYRSDTAIHQSATRPREVTGAMSRRRISDQPTRSRRHRSSSSAPDARLNTSDQGA